MIGVLYLSTVSSPNAGKLLSKALAGLLATVNTDQETPNPLYELYYEQTGPSSAVSEADGLIDLPSMRLDLAFNDSTMENVEKTWDALTKDDEQKDGVEYMKFEDREGADDDDQYE